MNRDTGGPGRDLRVGAASLDDPAARSLDVMRRAALKLSFFIVASGIQFALQHGFVRHVAALSLMSAILAVVAGTYKHEEPSAPHYTHFDEAVWFLMIGIVLRGYA